MDIIILMTVLMGLSINFYIKIIDRGDDHFLIATWKFFSYYTTLTIILVGAWMFLTLLQPPGVFKEVTYNANIATAITFYIVTVCIANYAMFSIRELDLLRTIADLFVHTVVPILMFVYWIFFIDKENVSFKSIPYWLIYPASYATYTILHGIWTNFYPYPFVNVKVLGIRRVCLNSFFMTLSVLIGGFLFVWFAKLLGGP